MRWRKSDKSFAKSSIYIIYSQNRTGTFIEFLDKIRFGWENRNLNDKEIPAENIVMPLKELVSRYNSRDSSIQQAGNQRYKITPVEKLNDTVMGKNLPKVKRGFVVFKASKLFHVAVEGRILSGNNKFYVDPKARYVILSQRPFKSLAIFKGNLKEYRE